ncbi:hypothetical protein [Natrialba sp. SSL1]|uniref:DUF7853 family protein n=1 Tax=Natrialba sp. SSL1 TaxID=1869245 RepID=UPI0008F90871|nr:hypothetical protein [Natrialba sp. SSL1]OIB57465.1 hypothetical protein BBD46_11720 [Natrialba sp. SSL1]
MSTPPSETEHHDVTLSREEEWVVHHSLVDRVDDALDEESTPPSWTLSLVETVESNDETEQFTTAQIRRLTTLLTEYVDREETPSRDVEHGRAAIDRLDGVLESRG